MSLSIGDIAMVNATINLPITSNMLIYANADIFSCAMIVALYGISQYITMVRLKHAVVLMQDEKHSITYCALESGFNSMRSFYRAFAKEFGCSPKEYIEKTNNVSFL